jgi:hypothetical protein
MPYVEIGSSQAIDIKKQKGVPFEGVYVSTRNIQTKVGAQVIYNFDGEKGPFGIFGFTNLNKTMERVPIGSKLRITYIGAQNMPTRFGIRDVHQAKVEIDTDFKLDTNEDERISF